MVAKNKTGYPIPGDVEFEDLSNPAQGTPGGEFNGSSRNLSKTSTPRSTVGKRGGRGILKMFGKQVCSRLLLVEV